MALEYPSLIRTAGSVTGATGAAVWTAGGVATARSAKGTWTLTLDNGIAAAACGVAVTPRGATPAEVVVAQTSATVKTVTAFDNLGAAIDVDFDFVVFAAPLS